MELAIVTLIWVGLIFIMADSEKLIWRFIFFLVTVYLLILVFAALMGNAIFNAFN